MPTDISKRVHPLYAKRAPQWEKLRDAIGGEDDIKAKAEKYLPKLDGHGRNVFNNPSIPSTSSGSYQSYLDRAQFFNATGRTVDGLVGAVLRKESGLEWSGGKEDELLKTLGVDGRSYEQLVEESLHQNIGLGRLGALVDSHPVDNAPPYVSLYEAEDIRDWITAVIDSRRQPVEVLLRESLDRTEEGDQPADVFRFRLLRLGPPRTMTKEQEEDYEGFLLDIGVTFQELVDIGGRVYHQEVWERVASSVGRPSQRYVRTGVIIPRKWGGRLWTEIPFRAFNPRKICVDPEKPELVDLVNVNLSHYRNSADLEHGLHFTALPQAYAAGFDFEDDQVFIGSGEIWVATDPGARAGYLEFQGQGLGAISTQMEAKKREMAMLGARLLFETEPKGVETEGSKRLRQAGDKTVLATIALTTATGWTEVLSLVADWVGRTSESVRVTLNTDYNIAGLTPRQVTALMLQVQNGLMSWETYFWNMKRGELIPDEVTSETEAARIEEGPPGQEFDELISDETP